MTNPHKKRTSRRRATAPQAAPAEAKVFMTGRSQAVRLPKEYRLTGDSVHIKRLGNAIVLTPKTGNRWAGLFAALDEFPRDFALERNQDQSPRSGLADLFGNTEE
jgi:antitoxin VapB